MPSADALLRWGGRSSCGALGAAATRYLSAAHRPLDLGGRAQEARQYAIADLVLRHARLRGADIEGGDRLAGGVAHRHRDAGDRLVHFAVYDGVTLLAGLG